MLVKLEAEVQSHLNKKKVSSMVQFGTLTPEQRSQLWIVGSGALKKKENANLNTKSGVNILRRNSLNRLLLR